MLVSRSVGKCLGAVLGRATKITFAQGHGYTRKEVELMNLERKRQVARLRDVIKDDWHIPEHILNSESFSYETELHSFTHRIGCNTPYTPTSENSTLSAALLAIFSHPSTCPNKDLLDLKSEMCDAGREQLSKYLLGYFSRVFPNISGDVLYKLSNPESCLSRAKCFSLYKTLCFHELIRSNEKITLEEYSDTLGGLLISLLLFDSQPHISAPRFLENFVLNYYSQIDFRNLANYEDLTKADQKMRDIFTINGMESPPEVRIITIDGEESDAPLYTVGIFHDEECVAMAAEHSIDSATLAASNAVITRLNFENRDRSVSIRDMNFSDVGEGVLEKGKEWEVKLRDIKGLKDTETGSSERRETVVVTKSMVRDVEKFRRLRIVKKEEKKKKKKVRESEKKKELLEDGN